MAVPGVRAVIGERGYERSNVVSCVCSFGEAMEDSYARNGRAPPVRTAEGGALRWKVAPGLGDAGKVGKRVTLGLGEEGKPMSGV